MSRIRFIVVAIAMMLMGLTAASAESAAACSSGKQIADLPNFGCVTDTLYRGGQPASAGFSKLREMGVGIVVNFRDEQSEITNEKREVESLGMKYVGIPWNGHDEPSTDQVVQFLDSIRANPQVKVFVHCRRGADRTGVMVAAYRIAVEHESVSEAISEMYKFHYAGFLLPQLKRYVQSLPGVLQADARFTAYSSTPQASVSSTPQASVVSLPAAH